MQHVALNHVAQRAGRFIERRAAFDAQSFGGGDLDVIDVIAIPQRLENSVAEAEGQQFCTVSLPR